MNIGGAEFTGQCARDGVEEKDVAYPVRVDAITCDLPGIVDLDQVVSGEEPAMVGGKECIEIAQVGAIIHRPRT